MKLNINRNDISLTEDLRDWFGKGKQGGVGGGGWDRYDTSGNRIGKCGDAKPGDPYSACLSREKAEKLGKAGIAAFVKRKRAAQTKGGDSKKGGEHSKGQKPIKVKTGIKEIGDVPDNEPVDKDTDRSYVATISRTEGDKDAPDVKYTFTTDKEPFLDYEILLFTKSTNNGNDTELDVSFKPSSGSHYIVTNANQQFKIMATVVKVIKDYLKKYPKITKLTFWPVKDTSRQNDNRRANLYMAYLKKQIPNAKVTVKLVGPGTEKYTVDLPNKVTEQTKSLQERLNLFLEKNIPTDPAKWSYYKSQAKKKFDVYPSAYANGWAAKKYKEAGGGWKKAK